jgi:hypothetical protein
MTTLIKKQDVMLNYSTMRDDIAAWLEDMSDGLEAGRFRFCKHGSFMPVKGCSGMVSTVFAMKIAWQVGIWEHWSEARKHACIDFIRSFQKQDGRFVDPWMFAKVKMSLKDYARFTLGKYDLRLLRDRKERNIQAETRQAAASLIMVGIKPDYPLPSLIGCVDDVKRYVHSSDWSQPWNAASHFSQQLMFISVNKRYFSHNSEYELLIEEILTVLDKMRDISTGTWFIGNPSNSDKINGAMKILSGLQWIDMPYPDCTRLLDFALDQTFLNDSCGFFNLLFVVYHCLKGVSKDFRKAEILLFATRALKQIQQFKKKDGGFSFYPDKAQITFLGEATSKGFPLSDMHGTMMMSWALAIIADLLGNTAPAGSNQWRIHQA